MGVGVVNQLRAATKQVEAPLGGVLDPDVATVQFVEGHA